MVLTIEMVKLREERVELWCRRNRNGRSVNQPLNWRYKIIKLKKIIFIEGETFSPCNVPFNINTHKRIMISKIGIVKCFHDTVNLTSLNTNIISELRVNIYFLVSINIYLINFFNHMYCYYRIYFKCLLSIQNFGHNWHE